MLEFNFLESNKTQNIIDLELLDRWQGNMFETLWA